MRSLIVAHAYLGCTGERTLVLVRMGVKLRVDGRVSAPSITRGGLGLGREQRSHQRPCLVAIARLSYLSIYHLINLPTICLDAGGSTIARYHFYLEGVSVRDDLSSTYHFWVAT